MPITIPQKEKHKISAGAARVVAIGCANDLDSGELLTGTPVVAEQTTSDLTISDAQVNASAMTIDGVSHAAGQAVLFKVADQNAGTTYRIRVTAASDSTPAQTRVFDLLLECV